MPTDPATSGPTDYIFATETISSLLAALSSSQIARDLQMETIGIHPLTKEKFFTCHYVDTARFP